MDLQSNDARSYAHEKKDKDDNHGKRKSKPGEGGVDEDSCPNRSGRLRHNAAERAKANEPIMITTHTLQRRCEFGYQPRLRVEALGNLGTGEEVRDDAELCLVVLGECAAVRGGLFADWIEDGKCGA